MKAKIIGKRHDVITYEVNGRKRHIVEKVSLTKNRVIVNQAIKAVQSFQWEKVWNWIDTHNEFENGWPSGLDATINRMTY